MTLDPYDLSTSRAPAGVTTTPSSQSVFGAASNLSGLPGSSPLGNAGSTQKITVTRPPTIWLLLSLLTALIGLVGAILFAPQGWPAAFTWLISGPISFLLLVVFTVIDNSRRTSLFYAVSSFAISLYWITLAVAFAGVLLSAWHLANWIGRI